MVAPGVVVAGASLEGVDCAQAGNTGIRTREAAAKGSQEGKKADFIFIILSSRPCEPPNGN
jgi:hypothetical protein